MAKPAKILLVEDDPNDVELTISALTDSRLGNEVVVVHDGEVAYLFGFAPEGLREREVHADGEQLDLLPQLGSLLLPAPRLQAADLGVQGGHATQ